MSHVQLNIIRIDKPSQFDKDLENVLQKTNGENTYLFFIGSELPETGESWCIDTRKAVPLVHKYAKLSKDVNLVEVPVGQRNEWKTPDNFYRLHPLTKLTNVPTLIKWYKDGPSKERLVEAEAYDEAKLRAYFNVTQEQTLEIDAL